jgi:hypothetical protein
MVNTREQLPNGLNLIQSIDDNISLSVSGAICEVVKGDGYSCHAVII